MVNLYGIPGAGKSTLAIHLGHQLGKLYPDCQIYFNLRGSNNVAVSAEDLLGGVLVALGVPPAEVPTGLVLRSASYRSALAAMRSIIVVDNASTAEQVEPLLPGSAEAAVLITSWAPIAELPGVHTMPVRKLDDDAALEMLRAVTRREITEADLLPVKQVVRLTDSLPLALRIAGGLLKAHPHWSWNDLLRRMGGHDDSVRLDNLVSGSLGVRATFDLAYSDLDLATARGYRLLGLAPSAEMKSELAHVLISADVYVAERIFDELVSRELLQRVTSSKFRMHDLIWLRANSLAHDVEETEVREAAVARMVAWSLDRLDSEYLPQLRLSLSHLEGLPGNEGTPLALTQVYVDSPVVSDDSIDTTTSLDEIFPRDRRVVLVAPGGMGKTTMAGNLCYNSTARRGADGGGPLPLIILARDLRSGDGDSGLETLIIRTLRHRYGFELPIEALQTILNDGDATVVVDGFDEVIEPSLRTNVLASIIGFSKTYPTVAMLVTTRHYSSSRRDFPGFSFITIAPWTRETTTRYMSKLATASNSPIPREVFQRLRERALRLPEDFITTPLYAQMALSTLYYHNQVPRSFTRMMDLIIDQAVFRREQRRGTLFVPPEALKQVLEATAYDMQKSSTNRVFVSQRHLVDIVTQTMENLSENVPAVRVIDVMAARSGLFSEAVQTPEGESFFAFSHTAIREHLAASHLARMAPADVADVMAGHYLDASWEAVFVIALELGGRTLYDNVLRGAERIGDRGLVRAILLWHETIRYQ
ncbi:hypothetical protein [Catellatospora paridis]|uniref:hypothetical protein n=1 Tax=Catellatospora paridis TaxID=1617086 RepID=UPI0012D43424|nr:hypothetical protein [Catellatospora paridis]